jgi:hypothetical protein
MKGKIICILLYILILTTTISADVNNSKYSSSINFYGEKTDVYLGEEIIARLSIVNLVSNPKMRAQVIILPSSGMSVTSAEFTKTSAGQFAANFDIEPEEGGRNILITLRPNQVGEFDIKGRVVYYFGEDKTNIQDYVLDLPVTVRRPTVLTDSKIKSPQQDEVKKGMMGFEVIIIGVGVIAIVIIFSVFLIYMLRRH